MNKLEQKYKLYLKEIKPLLDEKGFVFHKDCDSLGFTSLMCVAPELDFDVDSARDSAGRWHRRSCSKPCFPGHSKSTISRDMLLMLLVYCYVKGRVDIIEQVIIYALTHGFVMGKGDPSRTIMTPGLLSTYAWASYRLGGPSRPWLRYIPLGFSDDLKGYQAHLTVLHILLRNQLVGKDKHLETLRKYAKANPENALFQYSIGNIEKVYTILDNEQYFPKDRLPSKLDRKADYMWQRDQKEYVPGDHNEVIPPADFIFMYNLIKFDFI